MLVFAVSEKKLLAYVLSLLLSLFTDCLIVSLCLDIACDQKENKYDSYACCDPNHAIISLLWNSPIDEPYLLNFCLTLHV